MNQCIRLTIETGLACTIQLTESVELSAVRGHREVQTDAGPRPDGTAICGRSEEMRSDISQVLPRLAHSVHSLVLHNFSPASMLSDWLNVDF